jgi:hypothetical protein
MRRGGRCQKNSLLRGRADTARCHRPARCRTSAEADLDGAGQWMFPVKAAEVGRGNGSLHSRPLQPVALPAVIHRPATPLAAPGRCEDQASTGRPRSGARSGHHPVKIRARTPGRPHLQQDDLVCSAAERPELYRCPVARPWSRPLEPKFRDLPGHECGLTCLDGIERFSIVARTCGVAADGVRRPRHYWGWGGDLPAACM